MKSSLLLLVLGLFAALSAQTVTVTAPNGGETLTRGSQTTITWTKEGFTENVKIELYKNGNLESIIAASKSGTSYNWTVPNNIYGTDYKIKITSVSAAFINDYSDNNFTITIGVINITTPNGGEILQRGQSYNITWTEDLPENVKIELYQGGVLKSTIVTSPPSNGNYLWSVPNTISGTDFKLKISSTVFAEISDFSDATFTIDAGSISTISPTVNDLWTLTTMHEIKWSNTTANDPITIQLIKAGSIYSTITANAGITGSYYWAVPSNLQKGNDYQIKVSSIALNTVFSSTPNFSINGTGINGGDIGGIWQPDGSPYIITEKATVPVGNTLEIQAGTKVLIMDTLKIKGNLLANGLQGQSMIEIYAPVNVMNGSIQLQNCLFHSNNQSWEKNLNVLADKEDVARCIEKTTDGGYALAGYSKSSSGYSDGWVIKLDPSGNQSWVKIFYRSGATCIVQTTDGGYAVAGYWLNYNDFYDIWVIKLDASGNQTWEKTFNGTGNFSDEATSIVQTTDGGYAVAGYTDNSSGYSDAWVIKLNANGNQSWAKTFNGTADSYDYANSIVQTTDGSYAVAGYTQANGYYDAWVIKLDASGNQTWAKRFNGTANGAYVASSIVQTTNGGYAVAGQTGSDAWVIKLDANGNQSWAKTFNGTSNGYDGAKSIVQTTDGGYVVAGSTINIGSTTSDAWVIKLDVNGNQSWAKTFNGTANLNDYTYSIVQTTDCGYVVAGSTINSGSTISEAWVIKLDANGNLYNNQPVSNIILQNANANSYLTNCLFNNSSKSAIRLENSSPAITNCTFSRNNANQGGAIYANGNSTPKITNSIFWGNNATTGKQIYLDGTTAKPEFKYNLIEGGYSAIGLGNGAALGEIWEGNISTNPLFTDTINFQLPVNSPAVNAGSSDITGLNLPAYDLWGNARVFDGRIDIGAYECAVSDISNNLINDWSLSQNYPNPFNPQTMINYTIKDGFTGLVKLKIYNAKGEVVQTITNNVTKAGHYSQVFNGSKFASGIYYYGIEAGDFKQMKKMVMVK